MVIEKLSLIFLVLTLILNELLTVTSIKNIKCHLELIVRSFEPYLMVIVIDSLLNVVKILIILTKVFAKISLIKVIVICVKSY